MDSSDYPQPDTTGGASSSVHSTAILEQRRRREQQKFLLQPRKRSPQPPIASSSRPNAGPAVISSILNSFDALPESSPTRDSLNHSRRSSYQSANETGRRSASHSRRPPAAMAYEGEADAEDEYDAASPPTVPTFRTTPDLANRNARAAQRSLSARRLAKRQNLVVSNDSFGSMSIEPEANSKNKLSAESWVRQGAKQEHDVLEPKSMASSARKLRRKDSGESLRLSEKHSQQSLRSMGTRPWTMAGEDEPEQIYAKETTPARTPKERLFLSDSGGSDGPDVQPVPAVGLGLSLGRENSGAPPSMDLNPAGESAKRLSMELNRRLSIQDSVPTRTSSLRKRAKKVKRDPFARTTTDDSITATKLQDQDAVDVQFLSPEPLDDAQTFSPEPIRTVDVDMFDSVQPSPPIDMSWAELGEDDHTIKRIRQLREQRRHRIAEGQMSPSAVDDTFGDFDDTPHRAQNHIHTNETPDIGMSGMQHDIETTPDSSPHRGAINFSMPTPPPNQDGAFGRSLSGLSARETDLTRDQLPTPARSLSPSDSAMRPSLDAQTMSEAGASPTPFRRRSTKKRSKSQRRGGGRLPDLPDEAEEHKGARRRSLSTATDMWPRRDSIDDSVLEYLRAPRLNRRVKHPQTGRSICFSEVGDPTGHAVLVCVGMGLTRFVTAFFDELAATLGLRLVTIDRPGVGGSQAYPPGDKSGPLNWPDDVLAVCHELGIEQFSMLAHSAGAVYALATALILPEMIRGKIHLLAPWIPPSQLAITYHASSNPQQQHGAEPLPRGQRLLRVLPASVFKAANSTFISTTSASIKPATKKQIDAVRAQQQRDLLPIQPPGVERPRTADASQKPTHIRRESMMHMDQEMPTTSPQQSFGSPQEITEAEVAKQQADILLEASAGPTDPELSFAANMLSAAEYTEKARKIEYTSRLTHRTWELATRDSNPATDLLVCLERHREIGFRYTDIYQPVIITHGTEDKRVPVGNVKWLAHQMNMRAKAKRSNETYSSPRPDSREGWFDAARARGGCEIRVLDGEEHGLMASATIMSDVLEETAEYWRSRAQ